MNLFRSFATAATAALLAGCVIVTDRDDWDDREDGDRESWRARQEDNRAYIADLRIGVPLVTVRGDLGRPDFSEAYGSQGREVTILRYRTHHRHSDGETTRDETTPLVFVDGSLVGWGDAIVGEYPVSTVYREG